MTAHTTHWACTCGATGSYVWADITTKTDASLPDAKHQATCHGSVTTHTATTTSTRQDARGLGVRT